MKGKGTKHARSEGQTRKGTTRATWQGYINYTPTDFDKQRIKDLVDEGWDWSQPVAVWLLDGYRLSVSWDAYNDCYTASLYANAEGMSNAGWCLTARASDPFAAMLRISYVHAHVFGGDWSGAYYKEEKGEDGGW